LSNSFEPIAVAGHRGLLHWVRTSGKTGNGMTHPDERIEQPVRVLRLRPHHVLCMRYLPPELLVRGGEFEEVSRDVRETLILSETAMIEVSRGLDALCRSCPDCGESGCVSSFGDEEKVSRWDFRVMGDLGLNYGDSMTAGEFRTLIRQKAPLDFCKNRCPWKSICTVFGGGA